MAAAAVDDEKFHLLLCTLWNISFSKNEARLHSRKLENSTKEYSFSLFRWRQERTRAGSGVDDGGGSGRRRGVDAIIYNINPQEESSSSSSLAGINLCCGAHIFFLFLKGKKSTPGNIIIIVAVCRRCGWVVI